MNKFAKIVALVIAAQVMIVVGLVSVFTAITASPTLSTTEITPSAEALADIPADYLAAYQTAGTKYGVAWTTIAGIGKAECDHGRYQAPGCNPSGTINDVGARGPMQFLGSTWDATRTAKDLDVAGTPIPDGQEQNGYATDCDRDATADPWNIADAACATARMLKHNGYDTSPRDAIWAYNHSDTYVETVMGWATKYDGGPALANLAGYTPTDGWALPATSGKISYFGDATECQSMALYQQWGNHGSCDMISDPTLKWFIAMRWPEPSKSYPWWRQQRILIVNQRTNKAVVTVAGDWGPAVWTNRVVDVSEPVMDALAATTDDHVTISFVHPNTPAGPVTGQLPIANGTSGGLAILDWDNIPGGPTLTVNAAVANPTLAMIRAATQAGLPINGWGWRSTQRQIELRSEPSRGCGDGPPLSSYDIYEAPSSTCNPPTAPPGKSLHEQGLAIDFTCNGNTLRDTDPCHEWLVHNAHRYGYKPYSNDYYGAEEPWHWSTGPRAGS
jgi:hypothetical protein